MSFDSKGELERLRPEIIAQSERMRSALADGVRAVQAGRDAGPYVHILVEGETHPYTGTPVGTDHLSDALITAWEMRPAGQTVEEIQASITTLDTSRLPYVSQGDEEVVRALLPHVSTLSGAIAVWDGVTPEEYLELARTSLRRDQNADDIFEVYSRETGVSEHEAVRGGMLLLVLLEELIIQSA